MSAGLNKAVARSATVSEFLQAKRQGRDTLQVFTNNQLGRPFQKQMAYKELSDDQLVDLTVNYPAEIPDDVTVDLSWISYVATANTDTGLRRRSRIGSRARLNLAIELESRSAAAFRRLPPNRVRPPDHR